MGGVAGIEIELIGIRWLFHQCWWANLLSEGHKFMELQNWGLYIFPASMFAAWGFVFVWAKTQIADWGYRQD